MGVPCDLAHVPGEDTVDGILKVAADKKCDLIFISTHGNPGMFGSLFGTLATKILAKSKYPRPRAPLRGTELIGTAIYAFVSCRMRPALPSRSQKDPRRGRGTVQR